MKFLSDEQLNELLPAETSSFRAPVPTQIVSSDEYLPVRQTEKQREVEARLKEMRALWRNIRGCRGGASFRPRPAWPPRSSR